VKLKDLDIDVKDVVDVYMHTDEAWAEARERSLLCYDFCMNKQWTSDEITKFLKDNRPPIVYNLILPRLHNLVGGEQLNRRSAWIRASSKVNMPMADMLNGMFNNSWTVEEGEYELDKTFLDGLICTIPGWMGVDIEPNSMGFLEYKYRTRNPFSIFPDPDYRDYKLRDCDWIISEHWMGMTEMRALYGDNVGFTDSVKDMKMPWFQELGNRIGSMFAGGDIDSGFYDKDGHRYKVLEMQERRDMRYVLFRDNATGAYLEIEKAEADKNKEGYPGYTFMAEITRKRVWVTTVIPYLNIKVVDEVYFLDTDMYNLIPYCSFDYNNVKSQNNSLVNALLDPQKNLNKREIQKTTYIDHSINSPVLFSYEDKDTKDEFERIGNKPGVGLLFRNYKVKPSRMQPANIGMDIWNDIADSVGKMNDISGINEAARGQSEYSDESARLYGMKLERTGATINPYFRNLSKTRKMIVEYWLKTVKQVYSEQDRPVEIMDRLHNVEEITINTALGTNDIRQFEGRVVLDEGEYSPNKMQESMQTKMALMQTIPPELINWEWMLKDIELTDIQEQIDYMKMIQGQMADQAALQQAMQEDQVMTQQLLAEKELKAPPEKKGKEKTK
jgi:hypothetical protein